MRLNRIIASATMATGPVMGLAGATLAGSQFDPETFDYAAGNGHHIQR